MNDRQEALIARVLDVLAQRFDRRAILRGGMVLRVLGSPRFTNDLDYVFVPYKSKREIVSEVVECLKGIEGARVSHSLNSKCLRVVVAQDDIAIQVEAKVALSAQTSMASTRLFSRQFNLPPRMVCVMDHSVALAHNLAAWNERRLVRDIYDVCFLLQMGIKPDEDTLEQRLRKPSYSRFVKAAERFPGTSAAEFYDFVRERISRLSEEEIMDALSDYLRPEEIQGLGMQFRAVLTRLV